MSANDAGKSISISEFRLANMPRPVNPIFGVRLGFDIDGTIAAAPALFTEIATRCREYRGQVHIVTSRSAFGRRETLDELHGYGVSFDNIHFLGESSQADVDCPHKELDWYQRYLWQKVAYAKQHSLMHFVDDDPRVLSLFATYAPDINVISAVARIRIADPLYELAVTLIQKRQEVSISLIQRYLKLGYNRAVKLVEAMKDTGVSASVGATGSVPGAIE